MAIKLTNNAVSRLASGINASTTTLQVTPGEGARFPTLGAGDWFPCTLIDVNGNIEIIRVTARATDGFTIQRAQEGTAARAFSAGDRIELRLTAGTIDGLGDAAATPNTLVRRDGSGVIYSNLTGNVTGNADTVTNGVYTTGDQTIGGNKTFSSSPVAPGLNLTPAFGIGNGVHNGNGDASSSTQANLQIRSWYGIGFSPSVSGQPVPQNENAVWIDVRTGNLSARGNITAHGQFIGNGAGLTNLAAASTSAAGIVQLSTATNSTSTALAATASAVKAAWDLANSKQNAGTYAGFDTSATRDLTTFPIGHLVVAALSGSSSGTAARNAAAVVRLPNLPANDHDNYSYGSLSTGAALTGTWRARGAFNGGTTENTTFQLFQRTA